MQCQRPWPALPRLSNQSRESTSPLEADLAVNDVNHVAADPDSIAVFAQVNAAGASKRGPLGCHKGRRGESCPDEPLRKAGVEAAGDRVFVSAATDERAHLEGRIVTGVVRT